MDKTNRNNSQPDENITPDDTVLESGLVDEMLTDLEVDASLPLDETEIEDPVDIFAKPDDDSPATVESMRAPAPEPFAVIENDTVPEENDQSESVVEEADAVEESGEEPEEPETAIQAETEETETVAEDAAPSEADAMNDVPTSEDSPSEDPSSDIPESFMQSRAAIFSGDDEDEPLMEGMSLLERLRYNAKMRRREQTRQRRQQERGEVPAAASKAAGSALGGLLSANMRSTLIRLAVAAILVSLGILLSGVQATVSFIFLLLAFLVVVIPVLASAIRRITRGQYLSEYMLMFVASLGTFLLGRFYEASIVLILYGAGKLISEFVLDHTRSSVAKLTEIVPDHAAIVNMQGEERHVKPSEIKVGDFILVRNGERIPIDGTVLRGEGTVDDTVLTGENEPIEVTKNSVALAGSIYSGSLLLLRASSAFEDCTVSKILKVNEESGRRRASLENSVVHGFSRLMPIIAILLVLLAILPPLFKFDTFAIWIYRALTIIVICCPTALLLSVPLSFVSGRGCMSQRGIQVKGNDAIEKMSELRMVAFDKTGTLTQGRFTVKEVHTTPDFNAQSCLALAAAAEQHSDHPVARAVVAAYQGIPQKTTDFEEYPGRGVRARLGNRNLLVGNRKLMISRGVRGVPDLQGTVLYIAYEGDYAGAVVLEDVVRPEAEEAITDLKSLGVLRTVILTGDTELPAQRVADAIGIDTVHSSLLPEEKASKMEFLLRTIPTDGTAGYVGDGINDLPELKLADVGVAMGVAGSQETAEAANVLIMTNNLKRFSDAVRIAKRTQNIAMQNMMLVLGVKLILVLLTVFGVFSMWQAVAADVLMTILTVMNASRALHTK